MEQGLGELNPFPGLQEPLLLEPPHPGDLLLPHPQPPVVGHQAPSKGGVSRVQGHGPFEEGKALSELIRLKEGLSRSQGLLEVIRVAVRDVGQEGGGQAGTAGPLEEPDQEVPKGQVPGIAGPGTPGPR